MAGAAPVRDLARSRNRTRTGTELRVGVDLVAVADVAAAVERFGSAYLERVFTPHERACARGEGAVAAASLAARFAAKEAAIKALEPPPDGPSPPWRDIEVVRLASGATRLRLHGTAAYLAARGGIAHWAVSLSHEGATACAVVIASPGVAARPEGAGEIHVEGDGEVQPPGRDEQCDQRPQRQRNDPKESE